MNKPFSLFLILFLFIFQTAVFSADQACELIDKSRIKTIHIANFLPASIVQDVNVKVSAGYTEKQAKGIVGELIARTEIEEGKISVPGDPRERKSIVSFFESNGCSVSLKHTGDQGVDDVFIISVANGDRMDRRYNPIFHESKYDGRCTLKLSQTKNMCKQLSIQWLGHSLDKLGRRLKKSEVVNDGVCLVTPNAELEIKACGACWKEFRDSIEWLNGQLMSGHFYRTASVLCTSGKLTIYSING